MFTRAIVKKPGNSFVNGITTATLGRPDIARALEQHAGYIEALEKCGLDVTVLEADEYFPDSTFIEDTAILSPRCAVVTNPGAESRKGETRAVRPVIERFYRTMVVIDAPGTLDGGDVLAVEGHYFIGLSDRTNARGARALITALERCGYTGSTVSLNQFLHLKTGVTWIGGQDLLAAGELIDHPAFVKFNIIPVSQEDAYAANCIRINDYVLVPAGHARIRETLARRGYRLLEVEMSEFQKMDGGLSCLSLRF